MTTAKEQKRPSDFYDVESAKRLRNSEQEIVPLSSKPSDVEQKLSASQAVKYNTMGDGNCFFHAVFGENSSGVYKTDNAQAMRQEWCKFLSQFESLNDPAMPAALKERLSLVFHNVFPTKESDFYTSDLYKEYLNKISEQSYFIYVEEVPVLASLADIKIEAYYKNNNGQIIYLEPLESCALNPKMINKDYQRSSVWGNKKQETIYLEGNHYSRAKTKEIQEQEDFLLAKKLQVDEILEYFNIPQDSPQRAKVEERFDELLEGNPGGKIHDVVGQCVSDIKQCIQRSEEQSPSSLLRCDEEGRWIEKPFDQQTPQPVK